MSRIIRGNFGAVPYTRLILKQTSGNNIIRVSVGKPSLPVWTVESPGQSSKVLLRTLNQGTKMIRRDRDALRTAMKTAVFVFVLAGCGLYSALVMAGEITKLALANKHGIYQLKLEIILDAPAKHIHHVVTDFAHIYRLNSSIVESEIMSTPDSSVVRVKTLINDCFWIFCREILRVEDVRGLETGNIHAEIVPHLSNIKSGMTIWQIEPLGRRTRVNYNMIIEPGFVVPPLIGSRIVKQKLHKEVLVTLSNIERIAQIRNAMGEKPNLTLQDKPLRRIPDEHDSAN